ncbi:hypothetical protein J7T55_014842 [Diaporthe amygdali]|uniref:uncharacterized protein n=1 Tax=Phomopsis amygdali TaxID=1214568 RepID=UPI0022FE6B28|nr:uncharacterized protein J7T55_014842 [Diaporthe amygdali]KAJ0110039.1 hypothetical protein J7T55_014842 [Diaporthe amygdali]
MADAVSFVRQSMLHCSTYHEALQCTREGGSFMPTRVISIDPNDPPLRLVESATKATSYATLSYCWGGTVPPSTTRANISDMFQQITEDGLPVMFRQAIQLAQSLKIPYIWIDSLCIAQDWPEDWEAESERMCLYYENASLNIAPASSDNPYVPFIKEIDKIWWPISLEIRDLQDKVSHITVRRVPRLDTQNNDLGTLFGRAWTFQESVFARQTDTAFESPSTIGEFSSWQFLVHEYSSRRLTFATDKLPAISGAAAKFYDRVKCRYLAGLWADNLPQALIWRCFGALSELRPSPREYVAPSWSWASVTRTVSYPLWGGYTRPMLFYSGVKVLDFDCDVPGRNPYGKVCGGFMLLSGKTVLVKIKVDGHHHSMVSRKDWDFYPDFALQQSGESIFRSMLEKSPSPFEANVHCLYLATAKESGHVGIPSSRTLFTHYALVLGRSGPEEEASFCRLGLMQSTSDNAMRLFDAATEKTVRII